MSKDRVVDSLGRIDDDMIQGVEALRQKKKRPAWVKWGAMAACFCLLIVAVTVVPGLFPESTPNLPDNNDNPLHSEGNNHTEGPWSAWKSPVTYNSVSAMSDSAKIYIPGYFTEELSKEDIAAIEPGMQYDFMNYEGFAEFSGEGELVDVVLTITTTLPENPVSVAISQNGFSRDYIVDGEAAVSISNWNHDVVFTAYQWENNDGEITLAAEAVINEYYFSFEMTSSQKNIEKAKEAFAQVIECFACYSDDTPNLSVIVPDRIPEWIDETLTYEDALNDPDYGAYLLRAIPSGYNAESIRRYKDQNSDYLSGLWTSGYDELQWRVYKLSKDDENRLTSVTEKKNYDLSLYPIPRASSVPDELREIVNNPIFTAEELTMDAVWARAYTTGEVGDSDGWRMAFSVRYGDTVVEVRTKGVDPEWLYQQLVNLIPE